MLSIRFNQTQTAGGGSLLKGAHGYSVSRPRPFADTESGKKTTGRREDG
jgi:hypothetical protein